MTVESASIPSIDADWLARFLVDGGALVGILSRHDTTEYFSVFYSEVFHRFVVSTVMYRETDMLDAISDHELMFRLPDTLAYWLHYFDGLIEWEYFDADVLALSPDAFTDVENAALVEVA